MRYIDLANGQTYTYIAKAKNGRWLMMDEDGKEVVIGLLDLVPLDGWEQGTIVETTGTYYLVRKTDGQLCWCERRKWDEEKLAQCEKENAQKPETAIVMEKA